MAKAKSAKEKHPFLFYGHTPGDWTEGPQLWLIRFVEGISEEKRGKLGEVAAELLHGQSLAIERLDFATEGPWAALTSEESDHEPFPIAAKLLVAFHQLAPIAEVILATAREEGYSGWDRWSEKQQPLPSVFRGVLEPTGDEQVRIDIYFRTRGTDDDYPDRCEAEPTIPVEPSPAFEHAYRSGADRLFRAELELALAKALKSGKPALLPMAAGAIEKPSLTAAEAQKIDEPMAFARSAKGRVVAVINHGVRADLTVLDPEADAARVFEYELELPGKYLQVSPGGDLLLAVNKRDLIEIDLATGEARVVFQLAGHGVTAFSAAYLDSDDRVLAHLHATHATLLVRNASSRQLEAVADAEVKGYSLATLGGRFGFLSGDKALRVVGVHEDQVALLGVLKTGPSTRVFEGEYEGEKKVLVQSGAKTYEIVNLEVAYDKKFKKKKVTKKRASRKSRAGKKPKSIKLSLVSPAAAPDSDHEARWQGCFEWARWIGETASKRLVLRTRKGIGVVKDKKVVREIDLSEDGSFSMIAAQVHPTAERVFLAHGDQTQLSELDLDTGELRVLISARAVKKELGDHLTGVMIPAQGWVGVMQRDKLTLHRDSPDGLSDAVASMETEQWDMAPIRGGKACVLGGENESQIVEVEYDEGGTPSGFRHVATLKMPSKKYKEHHASPVMELDGELFLFTNHGCFRAPAE